MNVDEEQLSEFEDSLNPAFPEKSKIEPEILGYGEISTTFALTSMPEVAFKRMPPFENSSQITIYKKAVEEYCSLLNDVCEIQVAEFAFYNFLNSHNEHILYVAQSRLPAESIGHNVLKNGTLDDFEIILSTVMDKIINLYNFNHGNDQNRSIGLDCQLSNWSFPLPANTSSEPVYFDITTPLFRVNGKEQLDTEIFLKSCPSFLVWLVRWQFLDDVLDRYHDVRLVLIDIVANLYKEGRHDLIDPAISFINLRLKKESLETRIMVLQKVEIDKYYKYDAAIWSLFLKLRRFDRFLKTKIFNQRYNFILPGKITR